MCVLARRSLSFSPLSFHNPPTTGLPISRGAQDQGHTRQRKSFAGLQARGSGCLTVDESHRHITTRTAKEGTSPVFPNNHVRSSVSLGLSLWRGFAWKCSPPSQGCFVQITKETCTHHTRPPVLCLMVLSIFEN